MRLAFLMPAMIVAACTLGCTSSSTSDAGGMLPASDGGVDGGATLEFAAPCETSDQCRSGVCYEFGDGTKGCTMKCSSADDCPEGSQGKKCNQQGICRV